MTNKSAKPYKVIPGNAQHIGGRNEQQDSFGFSAFDDTGLVSHAGILAVVADGMGGLAMGREASHIAVQTFLDSYEKKTPAENIDAALDRCLHQANRAVNNLAVSAGLEGDVGTTLVAAVIHDGILYRTAAGDSRIYLLRQGMLRQLTTDYNYGRVLDRMVEKGEISAAEADSHPSRAALTSFLGKADLEDYDHPGDSTLQLEPGDKVLLASDGLFGFLAEAQIKSLLSAEPQKAAEDLVQTTIDLNRSYQDNITVAILGYGLPEPAKLPETARKQEAPGPARPEKSAKSAAAKPGKRKWLKITLALIILALLGFMGGRYIGRLPQPASDSTSTSRAVLPDAAATTEKL